MARKPSICNPKALERLRQLLKTKQGISCFGFGEMIPLQQQILQKTGKYLSVQTLNRFFGLVTNSFQPSSDTLNILSEYLGYSDFRTFERMIQESVDHKTFPQEVMFLVNILDNIPILPQEEQSLTQIARNLFRIADLRPGIWPDLYASLAATPFGQRYLFEQQVHVDALATHFGNGLQHYLVHCKEERQRFFGLFLLAYRAFLTCCPEVFFDCYNQLQQYSFSVVNKWHPTMGGCFLALDIIKTYLEGGLYNEMDQILAFCNGHENEGNFPGGCYVLGQVLILTGMFREAYAVLKKQNPESAGHNTRLDHGYIIQYKILQTFSGFFSGMLDPDQATYLWTNLKQKPVNFLNRHYFMFFSGVLNRKLSPGLLISTFDDQINESIHHTNFIHLHKVANMCSSAVPVAVQ